MALFSGIFGLIALICAIWVIYDVWVNNKRLSTVVKVIWTVLAVIGNVITAIIGSVPSRFINFKFLNKV